MAGAAMKWLRDNMGFIKNINEDTESLAKEVFSTGDVYFVPAFKGLYAPYWRKDARGCVSLSYGIVLIIVVCDFSMLRYRPHTRSNNLPFFAQIIV